MQARYGRSGSSDLNNAMMIDQTSAQSESAADDTFADGSIVCLRHHGHLVATQRGTEHTWFLRTDCSKDSAHTPSCLPAEALFVVDRHAHQFALRSLGAEGRYIQAEQGVNAAHRLSRTFTEQALWEVFGDQVINAYFRHKDLDFTIEHVTVIATKELAKTEKEQHNVVRELQIRLQCLERDGIEAKLARLSHNSSETSLEDEETQDLKRELEATKEELAAIRSEAQAVLEKQEEERQLVAQLVEERSRLDSALRFIKGMTEGADRTCDAESTEEDQHFSIGIPVESSDSASQNLGQNDEISLQNYTLQPTAVINEQEGENEQEAHGPTQNQAENLVQQPKPLTYREEFPNFAARKNERYETAASLASTWLASQADHRPRSASNYGPSDSVDNEEQNRVPVAGGGACCLVDYKGRFHPDTVNEQSMQRILDGPIAPPPTDDKYSRPRLNVNQQQVDVGRSMSWRRASLSARSRPSSAGNHTRWLSSEESYESLVEALPATETIAALDEGSPRAANLLTHYMSDATHLKASCSDFNLLRASKASGVIPKDDGLRSSRSSLRSSGGISKRSSFLNRPPVAVTELYG